MRSEIAQPCRASRARVRRIRRSSVPCGRSIRRSVICSPTASTGRYRFSCRSARGNFHLHEQGLLVFQELVPERGLEPPRPCDHCDLNAARLPVPPLGPECEEVGPELPGAPRAEAFAFWPALSTLPRQPPS